MSRFSGRSNTRTAQSASRVTALEVLIVTSAISNLIREAKVAQMYSAIQTGNSVGMQTLDQCMLELVKRLASRSQLLTGFDARFRPAARIAAPIRGQSERSGSGSLLSTARATSASRCIDNESRSDFDGPCRSS